MHIRSSLVHANHSLEVSPLLLSGNKIKNQEHFIAPSSNTYSPIHLFTFLPHCLEIKSKMQNIFLLRVKTPIHLFTYSLFSTPHTKSKQYQSSVVHIRSSLVHANHSLEVSPLLLSGNKIKNQEHFIAPSSNTYSPIHLFTFLPHCLEIKSKMQNIFLLRVKTPIHLFTYPPFPFILPCKPIRQFRRTEPKRH